MEGGSGKGGMLHGGTMKKAPLLLRLPPDSLYFEKGIKTENVKGKSQVERKEKGTCSLKGLRRPCKRKSP